MTTLQRLVASGCAGISIAATLCLGEAQASTTSKLFGVAADGLASGYRAAPALMLGMAMLAIVPLIALVSGVAAYRRRGGETTAAEGDDDDPAAVSTDMLAPSGPVYVELIGQRNARFAIARDMFRIGREADNDIRIPVKGIHGYHAAIHRQDMSDWWITDLSGADGRGLIVNGQKCGDARLYDGDVIELGPGKLRFHAGVTEAGLAETRLTETRLTETRLGP